MEHMLAPLPPFYMGKIAEAEATDGRFRPVVKVTCHDPVTIGQQIVQQIVQHSLGKPLEMMAKRSCFLLHCGSVNQASYAERFHHMAHRTGGHAPIKVQQLVGRWSADRMISWVTTKSQDEDIQDVHSADRGVPPPRTPTNGNNNVKMEAIMGVIRGGGERPPAAASTNLLGLVDPQSLRCRRTTGRSR